MSLKNHNTLQNGGWDRETKRSPSTPRLAIAAATLVVLGSCYRDLGTLGGPGSSVTGLNSHGLVVGVSQTSGAYPNNQHAYVYDPATKQTKDLGTAGGDWAEATDISDTGLVVGVAHAATGDYGVTWDAATGAWQRLASGSFSSVLPLRAGRTGWIAGVGETSSSRETVVWDTNGNLIRVGLLPGMPAAGLPNGTWSYPTGINSHGQVIGVTRAGVCQNTGDPGCLPNGFVWDSMRGLRPLNPPLFNGANTASPAAINDDGDIIGNTYSIGGSAGPGAWWRADTLEYRMPPQPPDSAFFVDLNNQGIALLSAPVSQGSSETRGFCVSLKTGKITLLGTEQEFHLQTQPPIFSTGRADRINDAGSLAGTRNGRAALWDPGTCK
jgi:probable HAF family extracellular repeat protein